MRNLAVRSGAPSTKTSVLCREEAGEEDKDALGNGRAGRKRKSTWDQEPSERTGHSLNPPKKMEMKMKLSDAGLALGDV